MTSLSDTVSISAGDSAPQSSLGEEIAAKAALAVSHLQERADGQMDYSEESLHMIEEILEETSQYQDQLSSKDKVALVELIGSYILEVARRKHGGEYVWHQQENQPVLVLGEPEFHTALNTFNKVKGRMSGDQADNIPFFYEGFAARVKSSTIGSKILYG